MILVRVPLLDLVLGTLAGLAALIIATIAERRERTAKTQEK